MKIVELTLSHYNFYCPATGQKIMAEGEQLTSPALLGVWIHEVANEPSIFNSKLDGDWKRWVEANEDDEDFSWEIEKFFQSVDEPDWVAFQIQTGGSLMSETVTIVIDMDYSD
jgi:hypothetical protein